MAKSKKKPKKIASSIAPKSTSPKKKPGLASKLFRPRVLSTLAFGTSGLLAGLATGLNHFPNLHQTAVVPRVMLLAGYLGDPHLDIASGLATAFTGVVIGSCLGFSALSAPKDIGLSLLLSIIFAVGAITFTGNVALAGLGFLAGHTPVIMSYLRLRQA